MYPDIQAVVTGYVSPSDLPAYYSSMDVLVQPSLAMACEKAVIGTRVGGITDAVIDCENGRLVSTNEANESANTIVELLTNEPLQRKLGRAARQTIMQRFTLQVELDENLAVYHGLGLKV